MRNGNSNDIKINNVNDTDKYVNSNHNGNSDTIKSKTSVIIILMKATSTVKIVMITKQTITIKEQLLRLEITHSHSQLFFTAMTITLIITMMILIVQEITLNVIPYSLWWWIDYDNVDKNINW